MDGWCFPARPFRTEVTTTSKNSTISYFFAIEEIDHEDFFSIQRLGKPTESEGGLGSFCLLGFEF